MSRVFRLFACLGVLGCLALASCSQVERLPLSNATLEGTVTYQGKPVPYGLVIATQAEGKVSATGNADENGKYKLSNVPLGTVQIAVNTEAGRGMMMGQMMAKSKGAKGASAPSFVDVPKKYFDPTSSGITTNVVEGPNTFNIELK